MTIRCIWEHNGNDTLLYASDYPGAFCRGASLEEAKMKMPQELSRYCKWLMMEMPADLHCNIIQDTPSSLKIRDADSDVLFESERLPLEQREYEILRNIALKSAKDFHLLYDSIPDHHQSCLAARKTFYGNLPCTAQEMYIHTRDVNSYYFGEIGIEADHCGSIYECRERAFRKLEENEDFLQNKLFQGSYDEWWCLRKVIRRFIWHDRIHAKAMRRMATRTFPDAPIADPFFFG